MPAEAVTDPPETFTATAVPLLKEYHLKLNALAERLRSIKTSEVEMAERKYLEDEAREILQAEYQAANRLFAQLQPAATDLARQVSGMIDQGRITPLEKAELRLRLAEFESSLSAIPQLLHVYRPDPRRRLSVG
jgi:hypothetical protein